MLRRAELEDKKLLARVLQGDQDSELVLLKKYAFIVSDRPGKYHLNEDSAQKLYLGAFAELLSQYKDQEEQSQLFSQELRQMFAQKRKDQIDRIAIPAHYLAYQKELFPQGQKIRDFRPLLLFLFAALVALGILISYSIWQSTPTP
ncbi:MAG: hypothetical protein AAFY71_15035 [Bacteroidota bacterium]